MTVAHRSIHRLRICDSRINDCDNFPSEEIMIRQIDNDGDGYVECQYDPNTWAGNPNVLGGEL